MAGDALNAAGRPEPGEPILDLVNVAAAPPRRARPLLSGITLTLRRGEIGVLVGGSGGGKSTLLRTAAGLWPARGGRIVAPPPADIALVLDDPDAQFVAGSVAGEIEFVLEGAGLSGAPLAERRDRLLDAVGLRALADRDPRRLSGGEKQRALIAAALASRPALLVLDDPFLHVGPRAARAVWDLLRRSLEGGDLGAVLLATGDADHAVTADRVGVLLGGALVSWDIPPVALAGPWPRSVDRPLSVWLAARLTEGGWRVPDGAHSVGALADRLSRSARREA